MLLRRFSALSVACLMVAVPVYPQAAVPDAQTGIPVFQLKARTVVVDVVVTNGSGQPVPGLHKQDFEVRESGDPQTITYFEEHVGAPPDDTPPAPHDANVFTNVSSAKVTDSVNVLLLDSLNTPIEDQAYMHAETMKYLKNAEPGTRLAIFTLGNELRFVQGFTADMSVLSAALNGKTSSPQLSALLRTQGTNAGEAEESGQIKEFQAETNLGYGADPNVAGSIAALQQFQKTTVSFETDLRVKQTLFALQQLARYLAGVPGRKNVIWFSGSFPMTVFPTENQSEDRAGIPSKAFSGDRFDTQRQYSEEVRKTDDLLASAQVAIYPIAAEGLKTDDYMTAESHLSGVTNRQDAREDQIHGLRNEADMRNANHSSMLQIAHDTGGEAFLNNNGLKDAVAKAMHSGSRYYTIAYTPTNKDMNGAYRKINVSLPTNGGYKLAYRRGYYSADSKQQDAEMRKQIPDPLHPYMGHGMPDSTQIPYTLNLVASPKQPAADAPVAGDNAAFSSASKGPNTRYTATIWVPVKSLHLEATPDGVHQDDIEAALVVYDHTGKAVNWMVRMVNLTLKPDRYAAAQQVGIPMRVEIDAPAGDYYLRTGIYEKATHAAGTLEVPLTAVVPTVVASR